MKNIGLLTMLVGLLTPLQLLANPSESDWIVAPKDAAPLVSDALVLDTRGALKFGFGHVEASQRVSWKDFTHELAARRGMLKSPSVLSKKLRGLGVSNDVPVFVVGEPVDGWGEDGRIVWMLRTLGHKKSYLVDGGYGALKKAGVSISRGMSKTVKKGDFKPDPTPEYGARAADVRAGIHGPAHVVDTREEREFRGATPYGETRGGHVPEAHHLYYKEFLSADGRVVSRADVNARMESLGISPKDDVIVYCTGGVRSAWLVVVLRHYGYEGARNYAGSMWEWASLDAEKHPLKKTR